MTTRMTALALWTLWMAMEVNAEEHPRLRMTFNDNWRFCQQDAQGFEAPGYDDSGWKPLTLPHDWSIEGAKPDRLLGGRMIRRNLLCNVGFKGLCAQVFYPEPVPPKQFFGLIG